MRDGSFLCFTCRVWVQHKIIHDQSSDSRYGSSDAAFDYLAGRECCDYHDCPHHNGMKKNAAGEWYNLFYVCPRYVTVCKDEDCPHDKGMLRAGGEWRPRTQ